jgi:outer membrane protein TolC
MEVLERTMAISEERVRIAESKKEVGSGSKFELTQARVDLNEDRSAFVVEQLRLSEAKSNINLIMGRDPSAEFVIQDSINIRNDFNFDDLREILNTNNSDILIAEQDVNVASADVDIARSDWFPRIDLIGGYDYIRSESESGILKSNKTSGFNYGLSAYFNIFEGMNTNIRSQTSKLTFENNKIALNETINRIHSQLFNTFKTYQASIEVVDLETENYTAAEENVTIALERFRLGSITSLEFREVQIDLLNAQNRLVNAQYTAKTAETELLRLTGQIVTEGR